MAHFPGNSTLGSPILVAVHFLSFHFLDSSNDSKDISLSAHACTAKEERERERKRDYCKIWCTEKRREGKRERENSLNWCFRRICANIWNYCHKRSDSPRSFFEGSRGEFRGEWLPTWLRASGLWIIARPRHLDGLVRRRDGKNGGKEDGRLRFEMRGLLGISLFGYAKCSHNVCAARTSACSRDEESTVYVGITRYVEY